jgi:hypothetical protein
MPCHIIKRAKAEVVTFVGKGKSGGQQEENKENKMSFGGRHTRYLVMQS